MTYGYYCGYCDAVFTFKVKNEKCPACNLSGKWEDYPTPSDAHIVSEETIKKLKTPDYYGWHPSGVECEEISGAFMTLPGKALEYIWRHGRKPDNSAEQDLRKAIKCLESEIKRLKKIDKRNEKKNVPS